MMDDGTKEILDVAYWGDNPDEAHLHEKLIPILKAFRKPRVFFDVGASLGQYTKLAAEHLPKGSTIVAFEADRGRFDILNAYADIWAEEYGVEIYTICAVVGDSNATVPFHRAAENSSISGSVVPRAALSRTESILSTMLDNYQTPDLVKVDVEGGEVAVLEGAKAILATPAKWLIELHQWPDPAHPGKTPRSIMGAAGYKWDDWDGTHAYFYRG